MIIPRVILAPLVGGIIGYITNDLAIRMLFRPRKAMYIGRFHIPMTPGLIPSQQGRIAQSIGEVVSQQLLNEETLRQTLLSQQTLDTLHGKITGFLRSFSQDERTVYEILRQPAIRDRVNPSGESMRKKLAEALSAKIVEARLGHEIVDSIIGNRMDFLTQNKLFSMLIDGNNTKEAIRDKLAEKVNELIADRAPDAAAALVNRYRGELMQMRLCDLYEKYKDREEQVTNGVLELYTSLLGDNLGRLLQAIDIEKIVVDKINALDAVEIERTAFDIMKHELRAIVYLGALLGCIMGFVNLLL